MGRFLTRGVYSLAICRQTKRVSVFIISEILGYHSFSLRDLKH